LRIARVTVLALLSRAQGRHLRRDSRTVVDDLRTPESLANLAKSETFTKGHEFDAVLSKYIPQKMIGQLYPTGAVTLVPNSEIMTRAQPSYPTIAAEVFCDHQALSNFRR
jgi:hypothetical protein